MRTLITGAGGQLGHALQLSAPDDVEVIAATREQLDICHARQVAEFIEEVVPEVIINCAAFTAVDLAESQRELAEAVNIQGPANLSEAARQHGSRLIHISTDYVFDGLQGRPYEPSDRPHPVNRYGQSKLSGEKAVLATLPGRSLIFRTSWLYEANGKNFVNTVLGRLSQSADMRVVDDQIGVPTSARSAAAALWRCVLNDQISGIAHWTDAGVASWYDFAQAILEQGVRLGLFSPGPKILPICTADFPTAARRPPFSVLDTWSTRDTLAIDPTHWRESLKQVLEEKADG